MLVRFPLNYLNDQSSSDRFHYSWSSSFLFALNVLQVNVLRLSDESYCSATWNHRHIRVKQFFLGNQNAGSLRSSNEFVTREKDGIFFANSMFVIFNLEMGIVNFNVELSLVFKFGHVSVWYSVCVVFRS